MPEYWQVRVKRPTGELAAVLTGQQDGFTGFSFSRSVNSPGSFLLYFMRRAGETEAQFLARMAVFEIDGQVEFWRRWPEQGIGWQLEGEFLTLDLRAYATVEGGMMLYVSGRGYLDLLGRRIVEDPTGSAEARKQGVAETVIKEYVEEQCGPTAGARALPGLTVQADGATGNAGGPWGKQYQVVLDVVQEIRSTGGGDVDVVGVGPAAFEFRWYLGQRGTDRTATILFALERGNMEAPELSLSHHSEITAVLVGGQGEEADRELVWRTDPARIALSPWNRREAFRDARQEPDTAGLEALGDASLQEGSPKETLTFTPLQVPGCLLGKDYFFGDLVAAQFMGYSATKQVAGYTYTWNQDAHDLSIELKDYGT